MAQGPIRTPSVKTSKKVAKAAPAHAGGTDIPRAKIVFGKRDVAAIMKKPRG
jgi:hypothetical protein